MLLVGQYDSRNIYGIEVNNNDIALASAYELSSTGDISELFEYEEPGLIRENYYSGKRLGDKDYDYPT